MSYTGIKELAFAEGYYHINFAGAGVVTFEEDTPDEIKREFWEKWASFREKVLERQRNGQFSSCYPVLPEEDPEENRIHYEKGVRI